jgi:hypothetical protein
MDKKKKYSVVVSRWYCSTKTVQVEADNKLEAGKKALETLGDSESNLQADHDEIVFIARME